VTPMRQRGSRQVGKATILDHRQERDQVMVEADTLL
jgi:hypothetical protein